MCLGRLQVWGDWLNYFATGCGLLFRYPIYIHSCEKSKTVWKFWDAAFPMNWRLFCFPIYWPRKSRVRRILLSQYFLYPACKLVTTNHAVQANWQNTRKMTCNVYTDSAMARTGSFRPGYNSNQPTNQSIDRCLTRRGWHLIVKQLYVINLWPSET